MRATDFEYRHQLLLHQMVVVAAALTYLIDRDDVIWRFIKAATADVRFFERCLFAVATIFFGIAAWLCTWAGAASEPYRRQTRYLGEFLYAIGLASLVPLYGSIILIGCEGMRLLRLSRYEVELAQADQPAQIAQELKPAWGRAVRKEAIKWGLFLTIVVFTITLKDRVAEVLIGATVLFWALLNLRFFPSSREASPR